MQLPRFSVKTHAGAVYVSGQSTYKSTARLFAALASPKIAEVNFEGFSYQGSSGVLALIVAIVEKANRDGRLVVSRAPYMIKSLIKQFDQFNLVQFAEDPIHVKH